MGRCALGGFDAISGGQNDLHQNDLWNISDSRWDIWRVAS